MNPLQSLTEYVKSSKSELEKVSWPSRPDTIRYSALVIAITIVTAAFFAVLDIGLGRGVDAILAQKNAIKTSAPPSAPAPTQTNPSSPTSPALPSADVKPLDVQAVTPQGAPADIQVKEIK